MENFYLSNDRSNMNRRILIQGQSTLKGYLHINDLIILMHTLSVEIMFDIYIQ